jgi:hypothetical protein
MVVFNNHHLAVTVFLFCLGTAFQLQGVFGDPVLQQMAIVVTWLPCVLFWLGHYYYHQDSAACRAEPPSDSFEPV